MAVLIAAAVLPASARGFIAISIDVNQSFTEGETVAFNYTLMPAIAATVTYLPSVTCPSAPAKLLDLRTVQTEPDVPIEGTYTYLQVDNSTEPQACNASVYVTSPFTLSETKEFKIVGKPSFQFSVKACKDAACSAAEKVFTHGEVVYLGYDASVQGLELSATLTMPDGAKQSVGLPSRVDATMAGTYEVQATATKGGFKVAAATERFSVIEKAAEIVELPLLDFSLLVCRDAPCALAATEFSVADVAYLVMQSRVEGASVDVELAYPNGSQAKVALPYVLQLQAPGNYMVKAVASMEGFQSATRTAAFSVSEPAARQPVENLPPEREGNGAPSSRTPKGAGIEVNSERAAAMDAATAVIIAAMVVVAIILFLLVVAFAKAQAK